MEEKTFEYLDTIVDSAVVRERSTVIILRHSIQYQQKYVYDLPLRITLEKGDKIKFYMPSESKDDEKPKQAKKESLKKLSHQEYETAIITRVFERGFEESLMTVYAKDMEYLEMRQSNEAEKRKKKE